VRIAIDARAAAEVPAGRGRYVRELIRGLSRLPADHEFALYARERWSAAELDARFRWRTVGARELAWPLVVGRGMSRSSDVALACTSYAITAPWRLPGAAIVWDLAPFDRSLRTPAGSLLERATLPIALRRCERLIAISASTREELERRFAGARGRTTVAHPAADARFSPTPAAGEREVLDRHRLTRPYVLATGTLEPRKNLPRLIEAFVGLPEHVRAGWQLVLAGAAGWQTDATFAAIQRHGELVRALGYVPDEELPCLYRQAELVCYPSLYEGFGIPVLEAMQCGTAVLTSNVSSMPEVGGEAARYADPRDVAAIRRALAELLGDRGLRERCAVAGLEQARRFDWDDTARRVLDVLERLGAGSQRRASTHTLRR
jgi:glycosyltransferase involved in cell wall biosynthesis